MKITAQQIANIINGTVVGDPDAEVSGFSKIENGKPGTVSFIVDKKYLPYLENCQSSVVIISSDIDIEQKVNATLVVADNARFAMIELIRMYENLMKSTLKGIHPSAVIEHDVVIGKDVYIGAGSVVMHNSSIGNNCTIHPQVYVGVDVNIGNNTVLMPGVKIYAGNVIGDNCIIHAGTVIGADGFGYTQENGTNVKIPQIGNVVIGNNVEIGANCTIDRAMFDSTIIHNGVKLDNLIHIAHNVEIEENTIIAALSAVAGSSTIGKNCMIGGQVGIIDHLKIGNNVKIVSQSGIMSNIKDDKVVMGAPAFNFTDFKKSYVCFKKLPEIVKHLDDESKNNQ